MTPSASGTAALDSVNPYSKNYGVKAFSRGPADQLPDSQAQTQYLHYDSDNRRLRYASDIRREELLDHDGDVAVSICPRSVFAREPAAESNLKASQLRVDTTQGSPIREYPHATRLVGDRVSFAEQCGQGFSRRARLSLVACHGGHQQDFAH